MDTPSEKPTTSSHLFCESVFLIAALVATALSISMVVSLIFTDFIHGNPNRTKENAEMMMATYPLICFIFAPIGIFIVFSATQIIQGLTMSALHSRFGRYTYIVVGLLVPFVSILAWYCYDYLTPSNLNLAINEGADWVPYQHGINLKRYLAILSAQGGITIFTLIYFEAAVYHQSRRTVILGFLFLAIAVGVFLGHRHAIGQYQFIS
ncbi:hypothetical protein [Paraburkholderia bannensis]|uniref:hypothetical protein n=1 Tax=Paraburkholderia bannensis TaxID=765414 RepID=UPI002AC340AE|nr:hypothetical protein [Paraburkholderia bannensis]